MKINVRLFDEVEGVVCGFLTEYKGDKVYFQYPNLRLLKQVTHHQPLLKFPLPPNTAQPVPKEPVGEEGLAAIEVTDDERSEFAQAAVRQSKIRFPEQTGPAIPHSRLGSLDTYSGMVADYAIRLLKSKQEDGGRSWK